MFRRSLALTFLFAGLAALPAAEGDPDCLTRIELGYYRALKPTDREMRWKRVPWVQDLEEAVKVAKKEKRPLFIWATDDEPLERC